MKRKPGLRGFGEDFLWQMRNRRVRPPSRGTKADLFVGVPFALLFASLWGALLAGSLASGKILSPDEGLILRAQNPDGFAFWFLVYVLLALAGLAAAAGLILRYRRHRRNPGNRDPSPAHNKAPTSTMGRKRTRS
jgi:hypothetical protein